jgi:hypothetical protein
MFSTPTIAAAAAAVCGLVVAAFAQQASAQDIAFDSAAAATPGRGLDLCRASAPGAGTTIEGTVLHVVDDSSLCVATGPTPDQWIPLVIEGPSPVDRHDPMITKAALRSAVFAKRVRCTVTSTEGGVAHAACSIDRTPVRLMVASVTPAQAALWLPAHS